MAEAAIAQMQVIPVQILGHETRHGEAFASGIDEMVDDLLAHCTRSPA